MCTPGALDVSPQIGFADAHVTLGQKKGYDFHQEIDHDFAYLSIRRSDDRAADFLRRFFVWESAGLAKDAPAFFDLASLVLI